MPRTKRRSSSSASDIRDENAIKLGKMADKMLEVSDKIFAEPKFNGISSFTIPEPKLFSVAQSIRVQNLVTAILDELDESVVQDSMTALEIVKIHLSNQAYHGPYMIPAMPANKP